MAGSRPHIILSATMSVDGKIATFAGDSGLSSRQDRQRVHRLRSRADAILVGINTINHDDPMLTVRLAKGRNPIRVILDSSASISLSSKILRTCKTVPTIIAVSKKAPKKRLERLQRLPIDIITTGEKSVSLPLLARILYERGVRTVMVEGGGTVNWSFIKAGLFDEMYVAVAPFVVGGTASVPLVRGSGFATICKSAKFQLDSARRLGDYVVLHYARPK